MGQKRAVLVGIKYPATDGELKACLNDVSRMRRCLVNRFGFDKANTHVLTNVVLTTTSPTGANIRQSLEQLVAGAAPGDILFFHYSGHGLQLLAETGEDNDTGYDECIVPCDTNLIKGEMNLIKDQDFTELVQKIPDGCLFTMVSDSCHSGGLIDKTEEQIGSSTKQSKTQRRERGVRRPPSACGNLCASLEETVRGVLECIDIRLPRRGHKQSSSEPPPAAHASVVTNWSLPLSTFIEMLKERTGKDDVGVGSIRTTLFHHLGDEATPKIKKFVKAMAGKLRHDGGAAGTELLKSKLDGDEEGEAEALAAPAMKQEVYAGTAAARVPRNAVLISGCQTDQTSADATTPQGVSYGALSDAIQNMLAEEKHGKVTNREIVTKARELLSKQGYTQQPGLYCSDEHANVAFIC